MMRELDTDVVVIGAGLAGLTAAYRLQQAGAKVCVLEANAGPGGRVQTVAKDGYLFDIGADALTDGYTEYLSLLDELGLRDRLAPLPSTVGFVRDGRMIYVDVSSRWSMAASPFISPVAKLRLAFAMRKVSRPWQGQHIAHMHRLSAIDDPDVSAEGRCRKIFGCEATDRLIDPMVRALGGTGVRGASWVEVVSGLGIANQATYCLRGGQAVLPQALAGSLDVRYGHRALRVSDCADGVTVTLEDAAGCEAEIPAKACVIATLYEAGCEIYPPLAEVSRDYGSRLQRMKLGKIQLGYRVPTRTNAYVIQVPTVEDPDVMLVFLDQNKCLDRAPPGHSLITLYTETGAADRYLMRTDAELTAWARRRVERWFPELVGQFDTSLVSRWPAMAPAGVPGHYARAAELLARIPAQGARVQIACDMFSKTSQEAAATWGANAARNLLPLLNQRRDDQRA